MPAISSDEHGQVAADAAPCVYRFGAFRVDPGNRLLTQDGREIGLPARSFDSRRMVLRRHGQLVTKAEMMDAVWAKSFVEESNLTVAISTLRRALGEDPNDRKYIQTVSGRGYRFIGEVVVEEAVREPAPAEVEAVVAPVVEEPASGAVALGGSRGWWRWAVAVGVIAALVSGWGWWWAERPVARVGESNGAAKVAGGAAKAAVDGQAYQLYLKGRYCWNRRTEEGLRQSIEYFRQSIAADPNYAPAYAGLADSYALLGSFSVESSHNAIPDARAAALSAIQLDPTLAEPHASLGMIYFFLDWNGPAAEEEFKRAIALNPNYSTAHHWYALDLAAMGRFPQALYEIHRAQALDPLSLIIDTNVGWIEYLSRDYGAALADYQKVLQLDPTFVRALTRRGIVEIRQGDGPAAVKDLKTAVRLSGDPYIRGLLGQAQAVSGDRAAAERTLKELQAMAATKYVPPFAVALVSLGLGRRPEAIGELQKAMVDRSTSMVYAKIDPSLDALRGDAEFQGMIAGMKF